MKILLHIEGPYDSRTETVTNELSIGRTELADVVIDDAGLSRVNTTFFVDDGELWVADENSTNGTFVNGERVAGRPRALRNGDSLKVGTDTAIRVQIGDSVGLTVSPKREAPLTEAGEVVGAPFPPASSVPEDLSATNGPQIMAIAAVVMTVVILFFGGIAYFIVSRMEDSGRAAPTPRTTASELIPARVIDPLGGEDFEDINDILSAWEVAEDELVASDVADIKSVSPESEEADLNVSAVFLADRQRLALENRPGEKGIRPAGLNVPKELFGDGVIKQTRKLREMREGGYQQPMDFADLSFKRLNRELIEMPMATDSFYLDVGGSAQDVPFTSFEFADPSDRREPVVPGHPKYETMKRLADNFSGQKYDLNNAADRKQIRRRLLRMFHPRARPILQEMADAYFQEFRRPLRVTSLTRSMDYQILLTQGNANAYKVRGAGALPPHTSGCAFDLARKHMPVDEQNFLMKKLAEMERENKLDALIEYGVNACFHVFIYHDGSPPQALNFFSSAYDDFPFLAGVMDRSSRDDGHDHNH